MHYIFQNCEVWRRGKKLAVRVEGNWGEPMDPLNPPSASYTNPVRNGYLRRSKWNGIFVCNFSVIQSDVWLKNTVKLFIVRFQSYLLWWWLKNRTQNPKNISVTEVREWVDFCIWVGGGLLMGHSDPAESCIHSPQHDSPPCGEGPLNSLQHCIQRFPVKHFLNYKWRSRFTWSPKIEISDRVGIRGVWGVKWVHRLTPAPSRLTASFYPPPPDHTIHPMTEKGC